MPDGWNPNGLEHFCLTLITGFSTFKWAGCISATLPLKTCGSGRKKKGGFGQLETCFPFFTQIIRAIGYIYYPENLRGKGSTTTRPKLSSNLSIPEPSLSGRQDYLANKSPYCSKASFLPCNRSLSSTTGLAGLLKHISTIRSPCGSKSL